MNEVYLNFDLNYPVISLNNIQYRIFQLILFFTHIFIIILIPLQLCFSFTIVSEIKKSQSQLFWILPVSLILLNVFELFLNFNSSCYIDGEEIKKRSIIIKEYVKNRFFFDLISLIGIVFGFSNDQVKIISILAMLKFFSINKRMTLPSR